MQRYHFLGNVTSIHRFIPLGDGVIPVLYQTGKTYISELLYLFSLVSFMKITYLCIKIFVGLKKKYSVCTKTIH